MNAVGQQTDAFASGQQDTLSDAQMTEPIRPAALRRGVKILVEGRRPYPELGPSVCTGQKTAAGLGVLASTDILRVF